MGQGSVTETVSKQISKTHMSMLMENILDCQAKSAQDYSMSLQVGGNLDIDTLDVDMTAVQQISCLSTQDLSAMLTDKFKSELESKVSQTLSGIPIGANVNVSNTTSEVVNYLTSDTTVRNIQIQAAQAKQKIQYDIQVGGNARIGKASATLAIDQMINGTSSQVQKIIKENTMDSATKSTTTQLIDGFMSGSTFVKLAVVSGIVAVIGGIIAAIVKLSKKDSPQEQMQYDQYYTYDQPMEASFGAMQTF